MVRKFLTGLAVVLITAGVAGALARLGFTVGDRPALATVALVVGLVALATLAGARLGWRLSTPYW